MTFMLRDRPDGQVEIIFQRPVLVGIFTVRDTAARVCAFLQAEEEGDEDVHLQSARFNVDADVAEVQSADLEASIPREKNQIDKAQPQKLTAAKGSRLPAVVEAPVAPAMYRGSDVKLPPALIEAALHRLSAGEKIADVAPDFKLSPGQLKGFWANSKRKTQAHIAKSGQIPCSMCKRSFTPSETHPETCARCSHG